MHHYFNAGQSLGERRAFVFFPAVCDQAALRLAQEILTGRPSDLATALAGQELSLSPGQ